MLGALLLVGHWGQGVTQEQAIHFAVQRRAAFCQLSSVTAPYFENSAVPEGCLIDSEFYRVDFSDGSYLGVDRNALTIRFIKGSHDARSAFSGPLKTEEEMRSIVNQCYQTLGYPYYLQSDGYEDYFHAVNTDGIRWMNFAPVVNGIPCGREYGVWAEGHPVSGAIDEISCRSLPNFNLAMTPITTVTQARPLLIGYLFSHANITSAIETEYDVKLRWGQAPLGDEVNSDTYIPTGDLATLRATNTALLMYDARFIDPNYPEGKGGGVYYRVIMDARTGEVVGMDGPVIAMFGGSGSKRTQDAGWDWGPGDIKVYQDRRSVQASGDVATLKNAGQLKPQGVRLLLQRGNLIVRASYDAKRNILWRKSRSGLFAGQPDAKLTQGLRALTQNRRQN